MCSCTGCKIGRRREREKAISLSMYILQEKDKLITANHGCGEEKSETMILVRASPQRKMLNSNRKCRGI